MDILILLVLVLLNGLLAMSEVAIVSARKARLKAMADAGDRGAKAALELMADPSRMFSTVQIGITLVGVVAGAYGATAIADDFEPLIARIPALAPWAGEIAFGVVIAAVTYLSLVLGELAPKRIGVAHPEAIASRVSGPMRTFAAAGAPLVLLLKASTEGVLKLAGLHGAPRSDLTEEEIQSVIEEGHSVGVIEPEEREMITGILRLGDRTVRTIMTPRPEIVFLDPDRPMAENLDIARRSRHSRFPVARGDLDELIGVVQTKDLLVSYGETGKLDLAAVTHPPLVVPETLPVLKLLETLRSTPVRMALVGDEYGVIQGAVTAADVLESIAGDVALSPEEAIAPPRRQEDGSWIIDGMTPVDELESLVGPLKLNGGGVDTAAGVVIRLLERIPKEGDTVTRGLLHFEVVDMDGLRVDKLVVRKLELGDDG